MGLIPAIEKAFLFADEEKKGEKNLVLGKKSEIQSLVASLPSYRRKEISVERGARQEKAVHHLGRGGGPPFFQGSLGVEESGGEGPRKREKKEKESRSSTVVRGGGGSCRRVPQGGGREG